MTLPVNYTTTVGATRTVSEMQTLLAKHGAQHVAVSYDDGKPIGLTFRIREGDFRLPVDIDAMHRLLVSSGLRGKASSREQAERVAWRVVKDWLAAQLSLVAASMVTLDEVMLPYLVVGPDMLLRDQWRNRQALTMGDQ